MPLSQKQQEYLAFAWQCFDAEPKIDYEKFRTIFSLASAHSARELLRVAKKALREDSCAPAGTPSKKAAPRAKTSADGAEDGDEDAIQYTTSTPRRGGGGGQARKKGIATPVSRGGGRTKIVSGTVSGAKRARPASVEDGDEDGDEMEEGERSPSARAVGKRVKVEEVDGMELL